MLSILLLAEFSLAGRMEALGPRGFLARAGSSFLWMVDFSDSSARTVAADFCLKKKISSSGLSPPL